MDRKFFAIFRIPESSLQSLKEHEMSIGYGIYCILLKQLRSGPRDESHPEQEEMFHGEGEEIGSSGRSSAWNWMMTWEGHVGRGMKAGHSRSRSWHQPGPPGSVCSLLT